MNSSLRPRAAAPPSLFALLLLLSSAGAEVRAQTDVRPQSPPSQAVARPGVLLPTKASADSRIVLRINVYIQDTPEDGTDERGRHAIAGPPAWIAERLAEYVEAGCDGFVVNLDHEAPGLEERVRRFAAEVKPLLPVASRGT